MGDYSYLPVFDFQAEHAHKKGSGATLQLTKVQKGGYIVIYAIRKSTDANRCICYLYSITKVFTTMNTAEQPPSIEENLPAILNKLQEDQVLQNIKLSIFNAVNFY